MSEPTFVAETLAWCNERRAERDMEPLKRLPQGRRYNGDSCPCGAATGLWVGRYEVLDTADAAAAVVCAVPPSVREFVDAFDGGRLPQYDEDAA